jgi:hypothetical protein
LAEENALPLTFKTVPTNMTSATNVNSPTLKDEENFIAYLSINNILLIVFYQKHKNSVNILRYFREIINLIYSKWLIFSKIIYKLLSKYCKLMIDYVDFLENIIKELKKGRIHTLKKEIIYYGYGSISS